MRPIQEKDLFQDALSEYENTKFVGQLEHEFRVRLYPEKWRLAYWSALFGSYLFNALSLATGSALLYLFLCTIMPAALAALLTAAAAVLLELAKRNTVTVWAREFFQFRRHGVGLLLVVVALSALSVTSSYHGGKQGIYKLGGTAEQVAADTLADVTALESSLARLRADKENIAANKDASGQTYYKVLGGVGDLSKAIAATESELLAIRQDTRKGNIAAAITHADGVAVRADVVGLVAVLCELLFLLLVAYCIYYKYKSYKTLTALQSVVADPTATGGGNGNDPNDNAPHNGDNAPQRNDNAQGYNDNNQGNNDNDPNRNGDNGDNGGDYRALLELRTKIKKKLNTNRRRLEQGKGTPATLRRNIAEYKRQVAELDRQIANARRRINRADAH